MTKTITDENMPELKTLKMSSEGKFLLKIVYWGCAGSGKTTAVDTLFKIVKRGNYSIKIKFALKKIQNASGATLYFDRGVFQSKIQERIFYHVYTVGGQVRFFPLRKEVFEGNNAIIFVFDGQRSRIEENINSLKELKIISENRLLVMVNKQDLPNPLKKDEVEEILQQEGLFYPSDHKLNKWNPIVYETIALYENSQNICTIFSELLRYFTQLLNDRTDLDNNYNKDI